MRVREQHDVDFRRVETQIAVHGIGLQTFTLVHSAVQQYLNSVLGRQQKLAASDLFGRTEKV